MLSQAENFNEDDTVAVFPPKETTDGAMEVSTTMLCDNCITLEGKKLRILSDVEVYIASSRTIIATYLANRPNSIEIENNRINDLVVINIKVVSSN